MDQDRLVTLTRSLSHMPSRREVVRGLVGASFGLGGLRLADAVEARNGHKGKKKADKHKKKRRQRRNSSPPDPVTISPSSPLPISPSSPPPGPELVLTYLCPGPKNDDISSGDGLVRFAQTFTAERSGSLRQIQFSVNKPPATTGDYLVQLLRVTGGNPSLSPTDVLAAITVPDAEVATSSDATVTGTFAGPVLVAGTEYAAAFSRPGSTKAVPNTRKGGSGGACGGNLFIADGAGPFNEAPNQDSLVSVLVSESI